MKTVQLVLSLVGLIAIALAYKTGSLDFLIIALAAFIGGLFYMGAIGRRVTTTEESDSQAEKKKAAKDKSRKEQ